MAAMSAFVMSASDLEPYLQRIGLAGPRPLSLDTLVAVHRAHAGAIAWETLDPWLGRPVELTLQALQRKLVQQRRGGYCYEQNLLLGAALRGLGFTVDNLAARVHWNIAPGVTRPRTHMLLAVNVAAQRYLVDAGFGGLTLTAPLRMDRRSPQRTPHGAMRLVRDEGLHVLEAEVSGPEGPAWHALYSFDLQPQLQADYEMASWYQCHHPLSTFRSTLMAARPLPDGRLNLRDSQLTFHGLDGRKIVTHLASGAAMRQVLQDRFGITIGDIPGLDGRLDALAATVPPAASAEAPAERRRTERRQTGRAR